MRWIEHRRHTIRTLPGQHLSQEGVALARRVGTEMGPFELVVTSTTPRAFETAIAMGFAVTEQLEFLATLGEGVEDEVRWDAGYAAFSDTLRANPDGALARYAASLAHLLRDIAERLEEGARALVISHGGVVEASAMGCLPNEDFDAWGQPASYCEGFRVGYESGEFVIGECLRVEV